MNATDPREKGWNPAFWWPTAQLTTLFLLVQSTRFFVDMGDDGFHYYAASLVAEGLVPYRDFFYGSAPGPAVAVGALLAVGAPVWLTKLLPLGGAIAAAVFGGRIAALERGARAGLLTVALVLASSLALRIAAYQGAHWVASGLVLASLYCGVTGRWVRAGVIVSIASLYDLHGSLGLVPLVWFARSAGQLRPFIYGLTTLLCGLLLALFVCGTAAIEQTIVYALIDAPGERATDAVRQLSRLLAKESAAFALGLAALLSVTGKSRALAGCAFGMLAVVWLWPREVSPVVAFPVLCVAAGIGGAELLQRGKDHSAKARNGAVFVVALLLVSTMLPNVLSGLARHRGKNIANQRIANLTRMVRQRQPASRRIWGDSAVVPTIAFRGKLKIAGNSFDTNDRRVRAGMITPRQLWDEAHSEGEPAILLVRRHGISLINDLRAAVWANNALDWVFRGGVGYRALYFLSPDDFLRFARLAETDLFDTPALHERSYKRQARHRRARGRAVNKPFSRPQGPPAASTPTDAAGD